MIKRIELVNFMSHRHTVIEPADGLTVLVGPNNCGKSAVVTALQILCHNDTSTYVTRHGEKECSITVETDDGHVIQWVRKKSGSVHYMIDGERHDRLRNKPPEVLIDLLRMPKVALDQSTDEFDIHFAAQKDPVFLLNESGRAAAGFFAASSDASRLIEMQKLHAQQVREANRDLARIQVESTRLELEIKALADVPGIELDFAATERQLQQLESDRQQAGHLVQNIRLIRQAAVQLAKLQSRADILAGLKPVPEIEPTDTLRLLCRSMGNLKYHLGHLQSRTEVLAGMKPVPEFEPTDTLRLLCRSMNSLKYQSVHLQSRSTALVRLSAPPELDDSAVLKGHLMRASRAGNRAAAFGARLQALARLQPPPEHDDSRPLKSAIGSIAASRQRLREIEVQMKALNEAEEEIQIELGLWHADNPTCPTCRQPWTGQQVLAAAKAGVP